MKGKLFKRFAAGAMSMSMLGMSLPADIFSASAIFSEKHSKKQQDGIVQPLLKSATMMLISQI